MRSSWRNICLKCILTLVIVFSFAFTSNAVTWWKVTAANSTGSAKTGLVIDYSGTGGTLANGSIVINGGPGSASIVAASSTTTVTWGGSGLSNGNTVEFKFSSDFSAAVSTVTWNPGAVAGSATIEATTAPEPVPGLGTYGIIGLILLLGLAGVILLRKRRVQNAV